VAFRVSHLGHEYPPLIAGGRRVTAGHVYR
jgi:hypothetical protein